jgi:hypothetical protein
MGQRVLPGQLEELASLYRIEDEKVERFLLDRPELVKILIEAVRTSSGSSGKIR